MMIMLSTVCQLIGAIFEVIGVILMANEYIKNVQTRQAVGFFAQFLENVYSIAWLLVSAVVRGDMAKGSAEISTPKENRLVTLQGLAFIGFGFLLQVLGAILSLLSMLTIPD